METALEEGTARRLPPWWLIAGGVGTAAALLYSTTVSSAWSWMDDWLLLSFSQCLQRALDGLSGLPACLEDPTAGRLRPGMSLYYALTSALFGTNAVIHHVFRLLLLVFTTIGVGGVAWRWTERRAAVLISTALFAFMPLGAGNWDKVGPTDVPALLLFVWAVFLVAGPMVPSTRTLWGCVALATGAALTKEPMALMNLPLVGYLWLRAGEVRRVRMMALGLGGVSLLALGAGLWVNLADEHSYVQQTMGLDLAAHLGAHVDTLRTGLFLPAFLVLCVVMVAEVISYRGDALTALPWAPLWLCGLSALAGWGHLLVTPEPQTRYVMLGMLPAVWIPALLWPLLPERHTASRVLTALVATHYVAAGMLTLPGTALKEAEWRATAALAELPADVQVGVLDISDVARAKVLHRVVPAAGAPDVQPWTADDDVLLVPSRVPAQRRDVVERCGGRLHFYATVPETVFTLRAALVGAEHHEVIHETGIWSMRSDCGDTRTAEVSG